MQKIPDEMIFVDRTLRILANILNVLLWSDLNPPFQTPPSTGSVQRATTASSSSTTASSSSSSGLTSSSSSASSAATGGVATVRDTSAFFERFGQTSTRMLKQFLGQDVKFTSFVSSSNTYEFGLCVTFIVGDSASPYQYRLMGNFTKNFTELNKLLRGLFVPEAI